ncbi:MAG: glycosyltransferase [candidate division SR1 bacterium]|nr:glycosyltransferase [candidate division SR1 bacterium]
MKSSKLDLSPSSKNLLSTVSKTKKQAIELYHKDVQDSESFKYNYVIENAWGVRLAHLFALIGYLGVIYGFSEFIQINIWYALFFGPLFFAIAFAKFTNHFMAMFYPKFDKEEHQKFVNDFWDNNSAPSVDIFLPLAGEDLETVRNTWLGVSSIEYSNKKVYVLDDKGDTKVAKMAKEFGFTYLCRPNKGVYKKSGNIQYGIEQSSGEYLFILDADFRPISEALRETVPYIVKNPKISILQTPQYFDTDDHIHKKSPIQYGAGSVVEEFYRVLLPSQMRFGAGKCVGTSGIYRRKAVVDSGGMPKHEGSEDIRIGLQTHKFGYHVSYLPLIISKGECPDNLQSYFKQQSRWADGTISTIFSDYYYGDHLDFWGKLTYLNCLFYFIGEIIAPIIAFQLLALLYFNTDSIRIGWILPFLPYLIYFYIIRPRQIINRKRYGSVLTGITHILAYTDALFRLLTKRAIKWESTGSSNKKSSINSEYYLAANVSILYMTAYIGLFSFIIYLKPYIIFNIETYTVLGIALLRAKDFLIYSYETIKYIRSSMAEDVKRDIVSPVKMYFWQTFAILSFAISIVALLFTFGYQVYGYAKKSDFNMIGYISYPFRS